MTIISTTTHITPGVVTPSNWHLLQAKSSRPSANNYVIERTQQGYFFTETSTYARMCAPLPTIEALLIQVSTYKDITVFIP